MKRILLIFGLTLATSIASFAQEEDNDNGTNDKIREKMSEFIQRRMGLSPADAERFNPIFFRYFREWKETLRANRTDKQIMQLRIAELRIRYRDEFKNIVGEKRCNQIYVHQEIFIRELQRFRQEQINRRPFRRTRGMIQ